MVWGGPLEGIEGRISMTEKDNGGERESFPDSPIFWKKKAGLPKIPGLPDLKIPLGGRKPLAVKPPEPEPVASVVDVPLAK